MLTAERAANWAWVIWVVSWWAASAWRKPAARRPPALAELPHLAITMIGVWLVFLTPAALYWARARMAMDRVGPLRLWRVEGWGGWLLFALIVTGFAFCWWARIHLGDLWSGTVTRKEGHRVVDTGPYALVRHPIYTGLILSVAATAVLRGAPTALVGMVLIVAGLWLKARLEERFLRAELGAADYDAYAARTPMLIPRLTAPAKT